MRTVNLCVAMVVFLGGAGSAAAQFDTASVVGNVRDVSGAVVPDAKVTLSSATTGISLVKTSTADGNYEFPAIKPGSTS
jgi:hypothetical protein